MVSAYLRRPLRSLAEMGMLKLEVTEREVVLAFRALGFGPVDAARFLHLLLDSQHRAAELPQWARKAIDRRQSVTMDCEWPPLCEAAMAATSSMTDGTGTRPSEPRHFRS